MTHLFEKEWYKRMEIIIYVDIKKEYDNMLIIIYDNIIIEIKINNK